MEAFQSIFSDALTNGVPLEEALADLRVRGATPVDVIKAIRVTMGVSLGEAKQVFGLSPAWAIEVQAGEALHEEVIAMLAKENES